MTSKEIRKELNEAKKLYQAKKYDEALTIYEKRYNESPEDLNRWDKIFYSWSLYQLYIKQADDEDKMFESAELVTELINQDDLNERPVCAYTLTVFKILDQLYSENDYYDLWHGLTRSIRNYWMRKGSRPMSVSTGPKRKSTMTMPPKPTSRLKTMKNA